MAIPTAINDIRYQNDLKYLNAMISTFNCVHEQMLAHNNTLESAPEEIKNILTINLLSELSRMSLGISSLVFTNDYNNRYDNDEYKNLVAEAKISLNTIVESFIKKIDDILKYQLADINRKMNKEVSLSQAPKDSVAEIIRLLVLNNELLLENTNLRMQYSSLQKE